MIDAFLPFELGGNNGMCQLFCPVLPDLLLDTRDLGCGVERIPSVEVWNNVAIHCIVSEGVCSFGSGHDVVQDDVPGGDSAGFEKRPQGVGGPGVENREVFSLEGIDVVLEIDEALFGFDMRFDSPSVQGRGYVKSPQGAVELGIALDDGLGVCVIVHEQSEFEWAGLCAGLLVVHHSSGLNMSCVHLLALGNEGVRVLSECVVVWLNRFEVRLGVGLSLFEVRLGEIVDSMDDRFPCSVNKRNTVANVRGGGIRRVGAKEEVGIDEIHEERRGQPRAGPLLLLLIAATFGY